MTTAVVFQDNLINKKGKSFPELHSKQKLHFLISFYLNISQYVKKQT